MTSLEVDIAILYRSASGSEQVIDIDCDGLPLDVEEVQNWLRGSVRLVRGDGDILALGNMSTSIASPCRLCMEMLARPVNVALSGRYLPPETPEFNPESDLYDPDVFQLDNRSQLDLTDLVRQSIITAIEPYMDCGGTCERYADVLSSYNSGPADGDIDPRLAPLRVMKAKLLNSSEQIQDKEGQ